MTGYLILCLLTAVFAMLALDEIPPVIGDHTLHTAINAVWISALLHGISAARWFEHGAEALSRAALTEPCAAPLFTEQGDQI